MVEISIVTAVMNDRAELARTMETVRALRDLPIEWIVVDGGSSDGTDELVEASRDVVDQFVSGPDEGVYDAWNKGLNLVTGRWVLFIGAGDEVSRAWLEHLLLEPTDVAYVYGDLQLIDGERRFLVRSRPWERALALAGNGLPIPHVATAHARSLFRTARFDETFRIHGDWEFFLRTYAGGGRYVKGVTQSSMRLGGISNAPASVHKRALERAWILERFGVEPTFGRRLQFLAKRLLAGSPGLHSTVQSAWHWLRTLR